MTSAHLTGRAALPRRRVGAVKLLTVLTVLMTGFFGGPVTASGPEPETTMSGPAPIEPELQSGKFRLDPGALVRNDEIGQGAPIDIRPAEISQSPDGGTKQSEWVIAPVPGYQPVMGATLALGVARIYRPSRAGESSPSWITGGAAFIAQNESWGLGLGQKMNLDDDRWRVIAAGGYADIKYRYYGIGNDQGDLDEYVPVRQEAPVITSKLMRRFAEGWYAGAKITAADSSIRLDTGDLPPGLELPPGWEGLEEAFDVLLAGVTPSIEYDSRDNEFFPRLGILFAADASFFSEALGSDFNFQIYSLAYNQYFPIGERSVIAFRAYDRVAAGDVPFFALSTLGQGSDIRGYTPGRYRDKVLVASQVEYRHEFSDRWSVSAFGGVGAVGPEMGDLPQGLPAGGFGVRFRLAKASKVSLRADVAWGRDDSAVYVSVGEAF